MPSSREWKSDGISHEFAVGRVRATIWFFNETQYVISFPKDYKTIKLPTGLNTDYLVQEYSGIVSFNCIKTPTPLEELKTLLEDYITAIDLLN